MAVITILSAKASDSPSDIPSGTRCSHRLVIPNRGRYVGSGPSAKAYCFGRAKKAGRCPKSAEVQRNGRFYCAIHAPPDRTR